MNQTTAKILDIFQQFRMPSSPIDRYDLGGKDKLADRIDGFVSAGKTLKFSMLGYPFKSMNDRDKVLGKSPDRAELASLQNFGHFHNEILAIYPAGVQFSIISDGYAFSAAYGTPDREVAQYAEIVKDMSQGLPIDWYDLVSFYPKGMSLQEMREKCMEQYGITSDELTSRILTDPDVNSIYRGISRFMEEDLAIKEFPSGNQRHKAAKILAREMMFWNEAYSKLVQNEFSDHIRLSMHQSQNDGTKYSFQLIPSKNAIHSPWHSCLLIRKDGSFETLHRKNAVSAGHELVYVNNQPYYFQEQ